MKDRIARALRTPLRDLFTRVVHDRLAAARDRSRRKKDAEESTFSHEVPIRLAHFLGGCAVVAEDEQMTAASRLYCQHRFNLLGSGWTYVRYGMQCPGLEGIAFSPRVPLIHRASELSLTEHINPSNVDECSRIWRMLPGDYEPIDWHVDFKSGYRWDSRTWYRDIKFGTVLGADVKVPWELSRLQHLPQLALAYGRNRDASIAAEIKNQLLDWIAMNPPRYGVNWRTTMDVAIRASNMLLTMDLLRAYGVDSGRDFDFIFRRTIRDHHDHVMGNLENRGAFRGNHYLANIAGAAFCGAYLDSADCDSTLRFAASEIAAAVREQFFRDGSNFEASSSYHRLSAEMVAFTLALLFRVQGRLKREPLLAAGEVDRVYRMRSFTRSVTKPDGKVWQIGDNDSGRFVKLAPAFVQVGGSLYEDQLDHSHLDGAIGSLFGETSTTGADAMVVRALAGGTVFGREVPSDSTRKEGRTHVPSRRATDSQLHTFDVPECALEHLTTAAFPDFGIFMFTGPRLFVGLRCGPVGQNGLGGHAHNDQLEMELQVEGRDVIADPGTYVYTPLPKKRDQYRSVYAHFAPHPRGEEQADIRGGLFRLLKPWESKCLAFDFTHFVGEISRGSRTIRRTVTISSSSISVADESWGCFLGRYDSATVPVFSPGYGEAGPNFE